jgi:hypothetical protein
MRKKAQKEIEAMMSKIAAIPPTPKDKTEQNIHNIPYWNDLKAIKHTVQVQKTKIRNERAATQRSKISLKRKE